MIGWFREPIGCLHVQAIGILGRISLLFDAFYILWLPGSLLAFKQAHNSIIILSDCLCFLKRAWFFRMMGIFWELPSHLLPAKKRSDSFFVMCLLICLSSETHSTSARGGFHRMFVDSSSIDSLASRLESEWSRYCILVFSLDPNVAPFWRRIMSCLSRALRKDFFLGPITSVFTWVCRFWRLLM